jgi:hypothetical protein
MLLYISEVLLLPGSPAAHFSMCNGDFQNINIDLQEQYVEAKMPEEPRLVTMQTSKHRKR